MPPKFGAATKKCEVCQKTAYPLESVPYEDRVWHKWCFKCADCSIKLTLKTFKGTLDGKVWCEKCVPKPKATQTADRHDLNTIREAPKIATVNENVRGELAGTKSLEGTDSMGIGKAVHAPKVGVVNEQVRGELAGTKSMEGTDSMGIGKAIAAPKVGVINEQVRGELAGQASQEGTDSMNIGKAIKAPKRDLINEQVRGADAGKGADFSSQFGGAQE
eukprot:CAMPEP_0174234792 /NCGR_PEP_ID=MMETSP0417-20130205/4440_1 /TAXON_ID=242541 /ORGANISM="Mayorella sp, Strain BSH-02190019" /LENGTH=217 /DNA_ID=CAMNT_0015313205 /DNA_START=156 /DNA_END=809 /DNA_ORIENTATION=+